MAAVVPGGLDLVGAEHDLLETAAHHGRVSLQPRKPRHPRAGLGLEEEAGKQGQGNNNLHIHEIIVKLTACCCLRMNFIGLLSALSGLFDDSKFPDKLD